MNFDFCLPVIRHRLPVIRHNLPEGPRRSENPCFYLRHMNADIKAQLEKVDGVDILDAAPEGATALFGPFYRDELALLIRMARQLRSRSRHCIAPSIDGEGLSIFAKRQEEAKP